MACAAVFEASRWLHITVLGLGSTSISGRECSTANLLLFLTTTILAGVLTPRSQDSQYRDRWLCCFVAHFLSLERTRTL